MAVVIHDPGAERSRGVRGLRDSLHLHKLFISLTDVFCDQSILTSANQHSLLCPSSALRLGLSVYSRKWSLVALRLLSEEKATLPKGIQQIHLQTAFLLNDLCVLSFPLCFMMVIHFCITY